MDLDSVRRDPFDSSGPLAGLSPGTGVPAAVVDIFTVRLWRTSRAGDFVDALIK